jgi:hypothetical protein
MAICEFWNPIYTCESDTKRIFRTCQGVFYNKKYFLSTEFWIT